MSFIEYPDRAAWLAGRKSGVGASEAAAAIGLSPSKSPLTLWKEKTGRQAEDDLSENERVEYGTLAEEHIRALFTLQHKNEYDVKYHAYRIYAHDEFPFLTCTLDGELIDRETAERGVWECKTAWISSRADLDEWRDRIPNKYYIQVLYQMFVTERSFAVLTAQLIFRDGNSEIKNYTIRADECADDTQFIIDGVRDFWKYVETDKQPPMMITL